MTRRLAHASNVFLWTLLLGWSLWVYPELPERIPRHFGLSGVADAYWETTLTRWLFLPLVAAGTILLVYASVRVMKAVPPSWVNVPNPEQFAALDDADQRDIRARMRGLLYWIGPPVLVLFGALQVGSYHVATTDATALPALVNILTMGSLGSIFGVVGLLVWWTRKWVDDRADARSKTDGEGAGTTSGHQRSGTSPAER